MQKTFCDECGLECAPRDGWFQQELRSERATKLKLTVDARLLEPRDDREDTADLCGPCLVMALRQFADLVPRNSKPPVALARN